MGHYCGTHRAAYTIYPPFVVQKVSCNRNLVLCKAYSFPVCPSRGMGKQLGSSASNNDGLKVVWEITERARHSQTGKVIAHLGPSKGGA